MTLFSRSDAKVSKKPKKDKSEKEKKIDKKIAVIDNEGFVEVTRVCIFFLFLVLVHHD